MPRSSSIQSSKLSAAQLPGCFEHEIIWGCLAGTGLGIGVILSFDVFYGSPATSLYLALLACAAIGALFGHIAATVARQPDAIKVTRKKIRFEPMELSDHKTLNMQIQAQKISLHVSPSPACAILSLLNDQAKQDKNS